MSEQTARMESLNTTLPEAELPVGAALDAAVAELVFGEAWDDERCRICGWKLVPHPEAGCWADNCSMRPPPAVRADAIAPFSTDWEASLRVVRHMERLGFRTSLESEGCEKWHCEFDGDGFGYDEGWPLPEAICRAAIRAQCDAFANDDGAP